MFRAIVFALLSPLLFESCGGSQEPTRLAISTSDPISLGGADYSLSCHPARGSVRDPAGLCDVLREQTSVMLPRATSSMCPGDFHSPQIVINGTMEGESVETVLPLCPGDRATGLWLKHVRHPRRG
jgi:hypothetical protein